MLLKQNDLIKGNHLCAILEWSTLISCKQATQDMKFPVNENDCNKMYCYIYEFMFLFITVFISQDMVLVRACFRPEATEVTAP